MGLLVVATYRDADAMGGGFADVLAQLVRERNTTRLRLGGLDADGVAEVIGGATGIGPSQRLVAKVRELTDGNPLYVGEAARLLATEGRLDDTLDSDRLLIPATCVRPCSGGWASCPNPASASSSSHQCSAGTSRSTCSKHSAGDDRRRHVGRSTRPLTPPSSSTVPDRAGHLRFAHAVMSEALTTRSRRCGGAGSTTKRVARSRCSVAATSDRASPSSLATATRASPSARWIRAVTYARLAAERAVQQLAYEEGARLYDMALRALAAPPDGTERMELLLGSRRRAEPGRRDRGAKATFIEAADLARQIGDVERLARAALGYGGRFVWIRAGSDTKVIPLLQEALAALPEGDSALRVRLLARLAGARRDDWDMRPRDELSAEAVVIAEASAIRQHWRMRSSPERWRRGARMQRST